MGKSCLLLRRPGLFLLLLFLHPWDASATAAEPKNFMLAPFRIYTETPEDICVKLSHLNESVTLSATLEYEAQNRSLIREVVSKKDLFQCIAFQVPRLNGSSDSSVVLLTVKVEGETLALWSQARVLVKNLERMVFVQMDKPIYKPEQKVQVRIISLDQSFCPLDEKFPLVYIQDPMRNRLFQWQDVELNAGLIQLSFPLTSDPALGTYRVVVKKSSGDNVEHTFVVEEYEMCPVEGDGEFQQHANGLFRISPERRDPKDREAEGKTEKASAEGHPRFPPTQEEGITVSAPILKACVKSSTVNHFQRLL